MASIWQHLLTVTVLAFYFTAGIHAVGRRKRGVEDGTDLANKCYEDEPWPCKTPGFCIALEYICDGNQECPDGYDEDPKLCRAKTRPPKDAVINIINKSARYLIPAVLGDISVARSAHLLTVASGMDEYAQNARMTEDQRANFRMLIDAVQENDKSVLERLGVPLSAWNDLSWLIDKLLSSGFEL